MPSSSEWPAPAAPRGGPVLVGITGPIGSGKSLLCRILAEKHGCPVIDADRLGHEALGPGGAARDAVVARFGDAVLGPGGRDRPRPSRGDRLRRSGALGGARVGRATRSSSRRSSARVAALKASGYAGIILLDAAVLPAWLDRLRLAACWCWCGPSRDVRLHRLWSRGLDPAGGAAADRRAGAAFAAELAADWSIDNDGTTGIAGARRRDALAGAGRPCGGAGEELATLTTIEMKRSWEEGGERLEALRSFL